MNPTFQHISSIRDIRALTIIAAAALAGCGDIVGTTGQYGNIAYTLSTDYELDESDLAEVVIVTGHPQHINLRLTDKGEQEVTDPVSVVHTITPSTGVVMEVDLDEDDISDLDLTVTDPGTYTIESWQGATLIDRVELEFDTPVELEAMFWAREPYEEDFQRLDPSDTMSIPQGTQVAFLVAPLDADGERLAGDLEIAWWADPEWAVVPGSNVYGTYEDDMWTGQVNDSLYFLEIGAVTITLEDEPNAISVAGSFDVSSLAPES